MLDLHTLAIVVHALSATDLHAPGWLVAVIAVGAVVIGNYAISVRKKTLPIQSM